MAQLFHVLSRGVDKRRIFMDGLDYQRFVHDLFEFNDEDNVNSSFRRFIKKLVTFDNKQLARKKRKLLVNLHVFCLMPNHYHLLLSEKIEGGISRFMKKLNMGYALYFNQRYERKGTLFEGRYKSVPINNDSHFIHIPYYIHLNPLDLKFGKWRSRQLVDHVQALKFLASYRWSSHLDYMGIKNFPSVTQREFLTDFFGGNQQYIKSLKSWLKDIELEPVKDFLLE